MSRRARGPWWVHALFAGGFVGIAFGEPDEILFRVGFAILALNALANAAEAYLHRLRRDYPEAP